MRITTHNPQQVDIQRLAALAGRARRAAEGGQGATAGRIEGVLRRYGPTIFVLAHAGDELVGWLGLWPIGDSSLIEINPGPTLGSHPFVSRSAVLQHVGTGLVEEAKTWAKEAGFTAVYLDFPWDLAAPQDTYAFYEAWYEALSFTRIQKMRHLSYDLAAGEVPHLEVPAGFEIAHIQEADGEELYRCHYAAFEASDAEYFGRMDDQERRADFYRIYNTHTQSHRASLVLRRSGDIVGLSLVFSEGEHSTLDSIGVHPDYRRQGLGECLLLRCLQGAAEERYGSMFLICDVKNQPAMELYKKAGFEDQGGSITYQWKA